MKDAILDEGLLGEYPQDDASGPDLAQFFKTLVQAARRNALLIGAIVVGTVVLGGVLTLLMTPTYTSSAQVLIEDQADQIIEGGDLQKVPVGQDTDRFLQTQVGLIKSRSLALNVVKSGRFDQSPDFFSGLGASIPEQDDVGTRKLADVREEQAIAVLMNSLTVDLPINSRIVTITIKSENPELAAKIANLYAARYIEYNLNQKYQSSAYARRYLSDQLDEARSKLAQSEHDLNQYARAAGLIRVSGEGEGGRQESALSVTNNTLVQLADAASKATAERIAAQERWTTISGQPALTVPEVNSNTAVMQLITAKAKLESDLADEQSRRLDGYPAVKAKRASIAELDRRIQATANAIRESAKLDFEAAQEREKSLLSRVNALRNDALDEQDRGVQYSVLKRVADTNRSLYESLLSRFNQLNASAGSASNNITLVDRAEVPQIPASPKLALNLILALIAGMLLAGAVVGVKELFDDAIRTPDDVERKLGVRLLGLIPNEKTEDIRQQLLDRRSSLSEAYRSLVTNLQYSTANGLPKVLAVTSSRESEGKSTTARSVARDVAELGKSVLLVDADLRRPTLHHVMQGGATSGLTDVLTGQKAIEEVVQSSDIPALSYISGLPMPPDPALILAGDRLNSFLDEARRKYDMIVLDCPPLLGLSDAAILANQSDGVLFVIDASSFHRGAVKSALRRLGLIKASILGVALNRFSPQAGNDDYKYYSYNYYSYGSKQE